MKDSALITDDTPSRVTSFVCHASNPEHSDAFSSSVISDRTCLISMRLLSESLEI